METVTVRKPYGRLDTIKPALASFIGTGKSGGQIAKWRKPYESL